MKTFIFTEERFPNRMRNNRCLRIYRVVNNQPTYLGFTEYSTGSTMGAESEAFHWLMDNGYIPKSYYNLSKSDWSGAGYYCQVVEDKGCKIVGVR